MNWEFNGIPLHPLFVHFAVVLVPLAALVTLLAVFWPTARKRLGVVSVLVAAAALMSAVLSEEAGQWLEERVAETALLETHVGIAEMLVPWTAGLFFVTLLHWLWFRYAARIGARFTALSTPTAQRVIPIVLIVLAVATAVGALIAVVVVGDTGAQAVWLNR